MSDDLVYRMTAEAQNNQMIDQHYLEAGALLVEGANEITRLRSRIEELERELKEEKERRARYGDTMTLKLGAAERERITDEQIDKAWAKAEEIIPEEREFVLAVFAALGIVACEECGGSGHDESRPDGIIMVGMCPACHGHGWRRNDE